MLFVLITIAWLAVATLFVALCRMAAGADAAPASIVDAPPTQVGEGLLVWELRTTRASDATRHRQRRCESLQPRRPSVGRRQRIAGHTTR
jgi:hypothetical protein